ncbi:MAG: transposase domain-containing protein [Dongiaceae bacterium]
MACIWETDGLDRLSRVRLCPRPGLRTRVGRTGQPSRGGSLPESKCRRLSPPSPAAKCEADGASRSPQVTDALPADLAEAHALILTNNAAERELRAVALGRKNWTFCGSDRGGERAAAFYTLIATAKLNGIDPEAWLADVLRRINDHPASRLHELLPWNWTKPGAHQAAAA